MSRSVEATRKTIEEAIAAACAKLRVDADDPNVGFEILAMPRKAGLFGMNGTPAKIHLHINDAEKSTAEVGLQDTAREKKQTIPQQKEEIASRQLETGATADKERIRELEKQVATLEEALKTLQNMQSSERMQEYVKQTKKTLDVAALVNATATNHRLDLEKQRDAVRQIQAQQASMEEQIRKSENQMRRAAQGSGITDAPSLFAYENVTNDTIAITGFNGFDCGHVLVIPETIDGKRVVKIADRVFENMQMEEVDFPKNLREIGEESFKNCSGLKVLELNHTKITQIGQSAFDGCSSLESVDLQNTGITTMGVNCFYSCKNLKKAALPVRLEMIPAGCFNRCVTMKQITIPDRVKKIGIYAFAHTAIERIVIPESVGSISLESFTQTGKLMVMVFLGARTTVQWFGPLLLSKNTTIYCLPGSAAQHFAQQYKYKCRPLSEAI